MRGLQDPNQSNVDKLNNVKREASRQFQEQKEGISESKTDEPETNSETKNIRDLYRGISDLMKG